MGQRARKAARLCARAVSSGVAFFDYDHGQTGVAPNAIELHPALGFACLSKARPPQPPPPPSGASGGKCAASYPDEFIAPPPPDLNCADIPCRDFRVLGTSPTRIRITATGTRTDGMRELAERDREQGGEPNAEDASHDPAPIEPTRRQSTALVAQSATSSTPTIEVVLGPPLMVCRPARRATDTCPAGAPLRACVPQTPFLPYVPLSTRQVAGKCEVVVAGGVSPSYGDDLSIPLDRDVKGLTEARTAEVCQHYAG